VSRKEYYTYILRSGENITNSSTKLQIDISSECGEMSFGIAGLTLVCGGVIFVVDI